jgi:hypothetical protein
MKKIKDLLNEFRDNSGGGGGGNNQGNNDFKRLRDFMEKTPFTHVTTGEDEIHFNSSQHAAETVAHSLAKHEMGRVHANNTGNEPMHEYFLRSTGTHDDVIDAISNHIMNHPKLPYDLIDAVPGYIEHIQSEEERKTHQAQRLSSMLAPRGPNGPQANMGEYTTKKHSHPDMHDMGVHPHLNDDTHHLKNVVEEIEDNPNHGYFLKKDEYK